MAEKVDVNQMTNQRFIAPALYVSPRPDNRSADEFNELRAQGVAFASIFYLAEIWKTGLAADSRSLEVVEWLLNGAKALELREEILGLSLPSQGGLRIPTIDEGSGLRITLTRPLPVIEEQVKLLQEHRKQERINGLRSRYGKASVNPPQSQFATISTRRMWPSSAELSFLLSASESVIIWNDDPFQGHLSCWLAEPRPNRTLELPYVCSSVGLDCVVRPTSGLMPEFD